MQIYATMMVRDEVDIITENIAYHLNAGFDKIIVTDNGSVDGTIEAIEKFVPTGRVVLLHDPVQKKQQYKAVTRMARRAARDGADWVLHLDADEFFVLDGEQKLHQYFAAIDKDVSVVKFGRNNLVGPADTSGEDFWADRLIYRDLESLTERGTPLQPKIAHRARRFAKVAQGNHSVKNVGRGTTQILGDGALIFHYPMRSWSQFSQKIENAGTAYAANRKLSKSGAGFHLKADYARLLRGELRDTYEERSVSLPSARQGIVDGKYVVDTRVANAIDSFDAETH